MSNKDTREAALRLGQTTGLGGASLGVIFALWTSEAINTPTFLILLLAPTVLFSLALRRIRRLQNSGIVSRPMWRYMRDFFACTALYMTGLGIAIALWNTVPGARDMAWAIALLPTLPSLAMIYVMARYLSDETDEFLRHRTVSAALVGLGFVLVSGSFWGFMETFGVVPNIFAWWVVPVWATGFGVGQIAFAKRDAAPEGAE